MRKDVPTIDVNASMQDAMALMKERKVALLPVMQKNQLIGVLTDRDLKRASASDATSLDIHELIYLLSKIKVSDIMSRKPVTVAPDLTIEEATSILLKNNFSGAPVVNSDGKVIGLISNHELFQALISLTGLEQRGVQFAFQLEDRPGAIGDVLNVIRVHCGRLVSILTSCERAPAGYRHVYIRAHSIDRDQVPAMIAEMREIATVLYFVDHRDNTRQEFIESFASSA
jgi:acetoin utilization protein AcuB